MAEHWRYQDRLAAGQLLTKRPKPEPDDVLLHGAVGYGRGELRVDERDARLLDYGLDYGKAGAAYGSTGLTGADIMGLGDGTLLGAGLTGTLRAPTLGLSALEDPRLSSGVDSGLLKGASVGLNGARSDIPSGPNLRTDLALVLGLIPLDASQTLLVEGLPIDCTRREAAHIFRPFCGYKEVRVAKKGSIENPKEKRFLCFVEFEDAYCAAKALEALRGYKFDVDDGDSEPLQMRFALKCAPRVADQHKHRRRRRSRR